MCTKNRDRLMAGDIAAKFMAAVLQPARVRALLSTDHFSMDGTLIDVWPPACSMQLMGYRLTPVGVARRLQSSVDVNRDDLIGKTLSWNENAWQVTVIAMGDEFEH